MKRKTDLEQINEAYASNVQRIDEALPLIAAPLLKTLGTSAAMTGGANIANKLTGGGHNGEPGQAPVQPVNASYGGVTEDENPTDDEPGGNITDIKHKKMIEALLDSLEELIKGNTGPDSPCGEREALEVIENHCKGRLHEMVAPNIGGMAMDAVGGVVDKVKGAVGL